MPIERQTSAVFHSAIGQRQSAFVFLIILLLSARIAATYRVFNDTTDEPYHFGAGLCLLETGKLLRGYQHPPLPRLIAALPVYFSGVRDAIDSKSTGHFLAATDLSAFDVGHDALLHSRLDYWAALTRARAAMLIFPIVLLVYCYRLTAWLGGRRAGLLAAAGLSFDPTLLGHASWITNDVAAAAGFVAALFYGLRFIARPSARRAVIAGVAIGLAVSCKFTAGVVAPALLLIFLLRRPRRGVHWAWLPMIAAISFLTLWATYFFELGPRGLPMPAFWNGLIELKTHLANGQVSYLNGAVGRGGWFWYFPEALLLKSPLALLMGLLAATPLLFSRINRRGWLIALPAALFLAVAMSGGLNIGVRHVLPVIALAYPLVAIALRRRLAWLAVLCVFSFLETGLAHPNYLSYFNLLAGGTRGGERYLLDSNLDWGQDQQRAADWLTEHARGRTISIHVAGNPRLVAWRDLPCEIQPALARPSDLVMISKNVEHGVTGSYHFDAMGKQILEPPLRPPPGSKPIATIGTSIDVYEVKKMSGE